MRFETQSKWEDFLDGFRNVLYILDCYDDGDEWGYREFWESLSIGWFQEYIYPYDDWYNPSYSNERRLRLAEKPPQRKVQLISSQYNGGYLAYDDNGFTVCIQPDREKADKCLEYYKSKYPDAIIYGSWDETND
jgi:hypothetical protein